VLPSIRITTFGVIVSLGLMVAVVAATALSVVSYRNAQTVDTTWQQYEKVAARKALLLSQVRGLLGYDGMIHHFKNFVLRQERWRVVSVHKNLLQLSIALTAYQALGLEEGEHEAFEALVSTVSDYKDKIALAETLAGKGLSAVEIDDAVKINDAIASQSLDILVKQATLRLLENTKKVRELVSDTRAFSTGSGTLLVAILLTLALTTTWFTYWRLIMPVQDLVKSFRSVNPHDPGSERLPFDETIKGTELGELATAGNSFLEAVHEHSLLRQRAEIEVRDREEHLRSVVENAVDAIININGIGTIISYNSAASTLFGYSTEEVIGKNVSMLMPEPYHSAHDGYLKNYLDSGEAKVIGTSREVEGCRKDGSTFPLRLAVSKTETSEGLSFTGIIRDLTLEKEAELRLRIAKQEAEKANQAKSDFLASMSHELRTPMNAIIGFTQLMETSPTDPPSERQKEYLGLVVKSGNHLLELINQVLDLSKIEAGRLEVEKTDVDIVPLIKECLTSLDVRAEKMGIKLETESDGKPVPTIRSDPALLRQVLLNLVSNAVKYNKPNGQVVVDHSISEQGTLRINVHDTGEGIREELQGNLFSPFNRLGREAGEIEGTGIGLSITKRIVDALGGRIGFKSIEGVGSDFWIDLPVVNLQENEKARADASLQA